MTSFMGSAEQTAHYQRLARDAAPASVSAYPTLALTEAADVYLAQIRRRVDDASLARDPDAHARFDAAVDGAIAATAGDPAVLRALVRQLAFALGQARAEARR